MLSCPIQRGLKHKCIRLLPFNSMKPMYLTRARGVSDVSSQIPSTPSLSQLPSKLSLHSSIRLRLRHHIMPIPHTPRHNSPTRPQIHRLLPLQHLLQIHAHKSPSRADSKRLTVIGRSMDQSIPTAFAEIAQGLATRVCRKSDNA